MRLLIQLPCRRPARTAVVAAFTAIGACRGVPGALPSAAAFNATVTADDAPPPPPARWLGLIGEYGPDAAVMIVLERDGRLWLHSATGEVPLDEQNDGENIWCSAATRIWSRRV